MRHLRWIVMLGVSVAWGLSAGAPDAGTSAEEPPRLPSRAYWRPTYDLQVPRPTHIAFSTRSGLFYLGGASGDGALATTTAVKDTVGSLVLPPDLPTNGLLTYDSKGRRMLIYDGAANAIYSVPEDDQGRLEPARWRPLPPPPLGPARVSGIATDPSSGAVFMLDRLSRRIARVVMPPDRDVERQFALIEPTWTKLDVPIHLELGGLAWHPGERRFYVLAGPDQLYALSESGEQVEVIDLRSLTPMYDLAAMVFAPSADQTDDASELDLYLIDPGNSEAGTHGHLFQVDLEAQLAPIAPMLAAGELVQTIEAFNWNPPSPDCSGLAWDTVNDRLLVSDGEVNEVSIWADVNLFESSYGGALLRGSDLTDFSNEPTGVAFDPNGRLFFTDDNAREIHIVQLGANRRFDASDPVSSISSRDFGSGDPEGIGYDVAGDRLFVADGVNDEVYEIHPGPDGEFDGNDVLVNSFDTGNVGISDPETVEYDPSTGTLYLLGSDKIVEVTTGGVLLTEIDISAVPIDKPAGLCLAPSSIDPTQLSFYLADRAVDNCSDSGENDGLIFEVLAGAAVPTTAGPNYPIADGSDDAEQTGSSVSLTSTDLDLEPGTIVGLRFPNIAIERGAVIDSAYVQFTADESQGGSSVLTLVGEDADDAAPFAASSNDLSGRAVTGNSVVWNVPAWSAGDNGTAQRSPQLVDIVEEIVGRSQWVKGNAIALLISSTSKRTAEAFEGGVPAMLRITLKNFAPVVDAGRDTTVALGHGLDLEGSVRDPLIPDGGALVAEWQQGSGPPGVTFADAADTTTTASFPALGVFTLRLWASDGALDASDSLTVTVVPPPPLVVRRVAHDDDDAEETSSVTTSSGDLDLQTGRLVGVRFRNIAIERGSPIVNAYVQFTADESQSGSTQLTIRGHDTNNAPIFTESDNNLSSRASTSETVVWNPLAWSAGDSTEAERTPNIAPIIQEIVGRNGWSSGNSIALLIEGTGKRTAETHDASPALAAVLRIEYAPPTNEPPTVDAGADQQIDEGELALLDGTVSDDILPIGAPVTSVWRFVGGPFDPAIADSNAVDTQASFPDSGTYVFSLHADDTELTSGDTMIVVVRPNLPPVVDAGPGFNVLQPDSAALEGSVVDDGLPVGSSVASVWRQVSGPGVAGFADSNAVDTRVHFSVAGVYVLSLNAGDGDEAATDTVTVFVDPNLAPTVDAGPDQDITLPASTTLDGTIADSTIPDGASLTSVWRQVAGPFTASIDDSNAVSTPVSFPDSGRYVFALIADDSDLDARDSVEVVVRPIPNTAPQVAAGPDLVVTLPDAATLFGSVDDDGLPTESVLSIAWRFLSGPAEPTFSDSTIVAPQITFPVAGIYLLSINVFDGEYAVSDSVSVEVLPNQPPTVDAGADAEITLPALADLDGTIGDSTIPSGSALTSVWRQLAGPFVASVADADSVDTQASFPDSGTYVFSLEASDGDLSAADSVTIRVLPIPNTAPQVSAGRDTSVMLPDPLVLAGTVSDDGLPSGGTLTQVWRLSSGPAMPAFADSQAVDTEVTFSVAGTYVLALHADDTELTAADSVTVEVVTNRPPLVDAGPDQTIELPQSAQLAGNASDGTIPPGSSLTHVWRQVGGSAAASFDDSTALDAVASFPDTGIYLLALIADDGALAAADSVTITVDPEPNDPPVVDAGADQDITIADSAALDGTVTDATIPQGGALTSVWRQVSGAGTASFGDSNAVDTHASFSDSGTYVLSLHASDGQLDAADSLTIHVSGIVIERFAIDVRIDRGQDDAEERTASGSVNNTSSDIELVDDAGRNQISGLRFRNVAIPQGATVTAAHIQFQADEPDGGASNLTIYGERTGNAANFTTANGNLSTRTPTQATRNWQPLSWVNTGDNGARQRTPDLAAIVHEIVNLGGWSEGNALAILFSGSGERTAESFNGNPGAAALLHVEFDVISGPPPPPPPNQAPSVDAGNDQSITLPASATLDATVSDDGQPSPTLFPQWSLSSGPDTPVFDSPNSIDTEVSFPTDGLYVLRLDVSDGLLSGSDSLTVEVLPQGSTPTTFQRRVARDQDDAEERPGGSVSLTSSDLELTEDGSNNQTVGMRFENVTIPRGAQIVTAWVQFQVDETTSGSINLTIRGQTGDAVSFTSTSGDVSTRPTTGSSVSWSPPDWNSVGDQGAGQRTPPLVTIIQEIVGRNDWSSGQGLAIIISGSGTRKAEAFDGEPTGAPLLYVEYH